MKREVCVPSFSLLFNCFSFASVVVLVAFHVAASLLSLSTSSYITCLVLHQKKRRRRRGRLFTWCCVSSSVVFMNARFNAAYWLFSREKFS